MFALHPQLEKDTIHVHRLPLCEVRLMNNSHFPWLVLVPQVEEAHEITDLLDADLHRLMDEICLCSNSLQGVTQAFKMNIAALGNQVPQLHIHVIARFEGDAAWPNPVWGIKSEAYAKDDASTLIQKLVTVLDPAR